MVLLCCGYSEAVGNRVGKHGCIYSVLVFTVIRKYGRRSLKLILKSCLCFIFYIVNGGGCGDCHLCLLLVIAVMGVLKEMSWECCW